MADVVDRPAPDAVLLDVRWTLAGGSDLPGYLAGHLPGALFLDLDADLAAPAHGTPGAGRHPLPDPAELQATLRRLGLSADSTVVVYDAIDGTAAVRAWWVLRWAGLADVAVLEGGLSAWTGPLETGQAPPPPPGTVVVTPGGMPTMDADRAAAAPVLLDARAAARYRGEVEPMDPVAGHIPGARNLPYGDLYVDGRLRPVPELRQAFAAVGLRPGESGVASCGSGVSAGHLVLAARAAGIELALYPGSYSGWCSLGRPVVTGDRPDVSAGPAGAGGR